MILKSRSLSADFLKVRRSAGDLDTSSAQPVVIWRLLMPVSRIERYLTQLMQKITIHAIRRLPESHRCTDHVITHENADSVGSSPAPKAVSGVRRMMMKKLFGPLCLESVAVEHLMHLREMLRDTHIGVSPEGRSFFVNHVCKGLIKNFVARFANRETEVGVLVEPGSKALIESIERLEQSVSYQKTGTGAVVDFAPESVGGVLGSISCGPKIHARGVGPNEASCLLYRSIWIKEHRSHGTDARSIGGSVQHGIQPTRLYLGVIVQKEEVLSLSCATLPDWLPGPSLCSVQSARR